MMSRIFKCFIIFIGVELQLCNVNGKNIQNSIFKRNIQSLPVQVMLDNAVYLPVGITDLHVNHRGEGETFEDGMPTMSLRIEGMSGLGVIRIMFVIDNLLPDIV